MNARQETKLSMYRTVQTHCNNNSAIINTNAAFMASFGVFNTKVSVLQSSATAVLKQTKGVALETKKP